MVDQIEVIDDFMPQEIWQRIHDTLFHPQFPWFYNANAVDYTIAPLHAYDFQFVHTFYNHFKATSDLISLVEPIYQKLRATALIRIKANMVPRTEKVIEHGMHVDCDLPEPFAAVYYVNTNDGYTRFKDGPTVNSVANRVVIFPMPIPHTGTTATNVSTRVIVNFNYYRGIANEPFYPPTV